MCDYSSETKQVLTLDLATLEPIPDPARKMELCQWPGEKRILCKIKRIVDLTVLHLESK